MTEQTPIDRAHSAMDAGPDGERGFYAALAAAEVFLLLEKEAEGDQLSPELFDVADARFVLVFDREDRLAEFAGRIVPYAAVSGRALAGMLAGQGIGMALNPEVAPSAMLLPPEAMDWLAEATASAPAEGEARIEEVGPPVGLPEVLLTTLDARLAASEGLARMAYLVGVKYEGGMQSHLLGLIGTRPGAEPALAQAVQEALTFSGLDAGALDVAFFAASDPLAAALARHGLRFDLPQSDAPAATAAPTAPGRDPAKPPKLR